jgi:hypothetical protein
MNSAGDWGPSDPLAVPKACREMSLRGHSDEDVAKVSFTNPFIFLSQNEKFRIDD